MGRARAECESVLSTVRRVIWAESGPGTHTKKVAAFQAPEICQGVAGPGVSAGRGEAVQAVSPYKAQDP